MASKINSFVKKLSTTQTGKNLFNPYNEFSKKLDDSTAPGVRQQNLRMYLNAHLDLKTKILWVYESPTFYEAKRSGIPLTNINLFDKVEHILKTSKSFEKATKSKAIPRNTAISSAIWSVAETLEINPIIWPVLPFYSHQKDKVTKKRTPTKDEIIEYKVFLLKIIEMYKPKTILAIGKNTKDYLDLLNIKSHYVQHPRRGKKTFKKSVSKYL